MLNLDNNAGTIGYTVSISEADAKWITYDKGSKAVDNLSFTVAAIDNDYFGTIRTGSIVISENNGGPGNITITVKQAGTKTMMIWPTATQSVDDIMTGFDNTKYETLYLAGKLADATAVGAVGTYGGRIG